MATTVAVFHKCVPASIERLNSSVSRLGRAACTHLSRVYPIPLGLGAELADVVASACLISSSEMDSHHLTGVVSGLSSWMGSTGGHVDGKNLSQRRRALAAGLSTQFPSASLRAGKMLVRWPFRTDARRQMSLASAAWWSHWLAQFHLARERAMWRPLITAICSHPGLAVQMSVCAMLHESSHHAAPHGCGVLLACRVSRLAVLIAVCSLAVAVSTCSREGSGLLSSPLSRHSLYPGAS